MFLERFLKNKKAQEVTWDKEEVVSDSKGPEFSCSTYRLSSDCRRTNERYVYLCLKCGQCGRKFDSCGLMKKEGRI